MENIRERYLELYEDMAKSANPDKMRIFGEAEKWAFDKLHERDPKLAEMWVEKLEATHWDNYLSRAEADDITRKLVNQDGTHGAHWSYDTFKSAVESLGGKMSDEPFYNCWALWATANMLYSDHARSLSQFVPKEDMPKAFYSLAVEKLKDVDRPHFVRHYFGV